MVNTRSKTKKIQKQASMDDQSGALIGSNDDLLTEILIRLPVTSILRFKSVSKHLQDLLSQRHFTNRYDKLSKSPGLFAGNSYFPFDVQNPTTPPFRTLDFYFDSRPIIILQSCNGLLLCRTDRPNSGQDQKYYVFNPTTKQLATIPSISGGKPARNTICCMGLAFHQTLCVHYKLVCIRALDRRRNLFQIQIYSSDTRKWKISIESFCVDVADFRNGVYWNGALFWAPSYRNHMYFKLDVEQLQTLPLPVEMVSSNIVTRCFGESRGHLHIIVGNYRGDNSCLNVYEMLIDCSGWFVKYQVRLFQFYRAFPGMVQTLGYRFHVVDVVRGEEEEDTFMVLTIAGEMVIYNVHHNTFNQIFTLPNQFDRGYSGFRRYTETLGGF